MPDEDGCIEVNKIRVPVEVYERAVAIAASEGAGRTQNAVCRFALVQYIRLVDLCERLGLDHRTLQPLAPAK